MSVQPAAKILEDATRGPVNVEPVWLWQDGVYERLDTAGPLAPEHGYWICCVAQSQSSEITGVRADGTIALNPGWNLVSPAADCVMPVVATVVDPAWYWDGTQQVYRTARAGNTLYSGRGYWILVDSNEPVVIHLGQ